MCLTQPADPRGGDVEELGGAGDRAGHHDGPDHLDLAQREVAHGARAYDLGRAVARGTRAGGYGVLMAAMPAIGGAASAGSMAKAMSAKSGPVMARTLPVGGHAQ